MIRIAVPYHAVTIPELTPDGNREYWQGSQTVRFLCRTHDIRGLKDRISREILSEFDDANIGIASSLYDIVGLPD